MAEKKAKLPPGVIQALKNEGFITRATDTVQTFIQCAVCPLAKEKFYAYRATKCGDLSLPLAVQAAHRLEASGFFINREVEQISPEEKQRPARIIYDVSPKAKEILAGTPPLSQCRNVPKA